MTSDERAKLEQLAARWKEEIHAIRHPLDRRTSGGRRAAIMERCLIELRAALALEPAPPPAPSGEAKPTCPDCGGEGDLPCPDCNDGGVTGHGGDCFCQNKKRCPTCGGTGDAPAEQPKEQP